MYHTSINCFRYLCSLWAIIDTLLAFFALTQCCNEYVVAGEKKYCTSTRLVLIFMWKGLRYMPLSQESKLWPYDHESHTLSARPHSFMNFLSTCHYIKPYILYEAAISSRYLYSPICNHSLQGRCNVTIVNRRLTTYLHSLHFHLCFSDINLILAVYKVCIQRKYATDCRNYHH